MSEAIGQEYVQPFGKEVQPGVIDYAPLD
jgi:hypothetical protein